MFCNLEHQLLSFYKNQNFPPASYVYLAVSGGLDSMAMLALHQKIAKVLKIHLIVVHIHHGVLTGKEFSIQNSFRNKAYKTVQEYCEKHNIKFISNILEENREQGLKDKNSKQKAEQKLEGSEAEYRKYRYDYFEKILLDSKFVSKILVTAHTANDLLETRLLRLMRGVGPQGFISIKPVSDKKKYLLVRPLLKVLRSDLEDYMREKDMPFCEDPSNQSTKFLRNWLRLEVLPIVVKKEKKYLQNMSQSLNLIASELDEDSSFLREGLIIENKIKLSLFYSLSVAKQKRVLAHYLYCNKVKNYSMGHVLELLKYLNAPRKEQSFFVAKQCWKLKEAWLYILDNSSKSIKLKTD